DIDLRRLRDDQSEEPGSDDERCRRQQLERGRPRPHTRSTSPRPREKSPSGRTSRTRITSPNTNDGRYWLWLDGKAPPRSPETYPMKKPPKVAETRRVMPPTTTPARTMIVSWSA